MTSSKPQPQPDPACEPGSRPLRCFTRTGVGSQPALGSADGLGNFLSMGLLRDLFAAEYVVAAGRRSA